MNVDPIWMNVEQIWMNDDRAGMNVDPIGMNGDRAGMNIDPVGMNVDQIWMNVEPIWMNVDLIWMNVEPGAITFCAESGIFHHEGHEEPRRFFIRTERNNEIDEICLPFSRFDSAVSASFKSLGQGQPHITMRGSEK